MKKKFKVGDLVYLKNVGFPFNRTDDGHESWEGASCVVTEPVVNTQYVRVKPIFPIKCGNYSMDECVFHPENVIKENRPWLKKNLSKIVKSKNELLDISEKVQDLLNVI